MGFPSRSVTAKEQVASYPTPFTFEGSIPEVFRICLQHNAKAPQISAVDCSKIRWSVGERWVFVASGWLATLRADRVGWSLRAEEDGMLEKGKEGM